MREWAGGHEALDERRYHEENIAEHHCAASGAPSRASQRVNRPGAMIAQPSRRPRLPRERSPQLHDAVGHDEQ